jgi:hypothetical protein
MSDRSAQNFRIRGNIATFPVERGFERRATQTIRA